MTTGIGKDYMLQKILFAATDLGNRDGKIDNSEEDKSAREYIESAFAIAKKHLSEKDKEAIKNDADIIATGIDLDELLGAEWSGTAKAEKSEKADKKKKESPTEKADRRYKELASVSEQELKDFVVLKHGFLNGRKLTAYDLLEDYLKKDGVKNSDGTYNLQELAADVIQDASIGPDRELNQNAHGSEISKEQADAAGRLVDNLGAAFSKLTVDKGVRKYKQKYEREIVENMVDFLGGTVEHNQHKTIDAAKEGFKNGLPAALAMLVNPANYVEQQQLTVLNTGGGTANVSRELLTRLAERLKVEAHNEQDVARITKEVLGEGFSALWNYQVVISAFANAGIALGTTLVMEMLKDVIIGEERDENAVIKMDPYSSTTNKKDEARRTYLKDYLAIINSDAGVYAVPEQYREAINEIAKQFVYQYCLGPKKDENGEVVRDAEGKIVYEYEERFDYTEMYAFLRENSGNDTMNATEFIKAVMNVESMQRHIEIMNARAEKMNADCKEKCDCDPVEKPKQPEKPVQLDNEGVNGQVAETSFEIQIDRLNRKDSGWGKLAELYPCIKDYANTTIKIGKKHIPTDRRIIKLIQGINDGDYSKQRIMELLDYVQHDPEKLKNLPYFNYSDYKSALEGMPGLDTKLPTHILYDRTKPIDSDENKGCERKPLENLGIAKQSGGTGLKANTSARDTGYKYAYKDPDGIWIKCSKEVFEQKVAQGYETKKWPDTKLD